jgi:hypothetical protein
MDIPTAAFLLGCLVGVIERDIDSGRYPVFDIRTREARMTLLRLYTPAVMSARKGETVKQPTIAQIADHILPPLPHFSAVRVSWIFHCSQTHISRLIESGDIPAKGRFPAAGKPCRPWRIPRESLEKFLSARLIAL